jgi:hypothetical protein
MGPVADLSTAGWLNGASIADELTLLTQGIANPVQMVRGQLVLHHRNIPELYGVETRGLNQALERNVGRLRVGMMATLTKHGAATVFPLLIKERKLLPIPGNFPPDSRHQAIRKKSSAIS